MTYVKERPTTKGGKVQDTGLASPSNNLNSAAVAASPLPDDGHPDDDHHDERSDSDREPTATSAPPDLEALTVRCPIDQPLTFYPSESEFADEQPTSLSLMVLEAALVPDDMVLLDCRLTLQVPFAVYQDILRHHWFNLIPAILHPDHDEDFNPEDDILLEIGLKPDFLEQLTTLLSETSISTSDLSDHSSDEPLTDDITGGGINPETIVQYLIALNKDLTKEKSDEISPLFQTDQWLCCSVKQPLAEGEVGYSTLWSYLLIHPLVNNEADLSGNEDIAEVFTTLFKEAAVTFQSEFEKQLPQLQSNWLEFLDGLKEIVDEVVDDLKTDGEETEDGGDTADGGALLSDPATLRMDKASVSLMDRVVKPFFDSEDWSFVQLDETTLQLAFQGNNGRWTCLAESNDDTQQFIFYSLYPFQVDSAHYAAMSEFLMRANGGMIIGNFELDFESGELRFKTSVDVDGIRLNLSSCHSVYQQLWQQLAYINVITMDRYFPGITAIVNQTLTPEEAIALVEPSIDTREVEESIGPRE